MYLIINTSADNCQLFGYRGFDLVFQKRWQDNHDLARNLLRIIDEQLNSNQLRLKDIDGLGIYLGPGSFTGLRIGATTFNTLATELNIPIVGANGDDWMKLVLDKLNSHKNDYHIMPFYGSEANITKPRH